MLSVGRQHDRVHPAPEGVHQPVQLQKRLAPGLRRAEAVFEASHHRVRGGGANSHFPRRLDPGG